MAQRAVATTGVVNTLIDCLVAALTVAGLANRLIVVDCTNPSKDN